MSVLSPPPVSIVQMGHVEKIVEVAQNQSLVQQQVVQEEAARLLREKHVDPTDPSKESRDVKNKEKDQSRKKGFSERRKRKRPEAESPEPSIPDSPVAGIFVNKKV